MTELLRPAAGSSQGSDQFLADLVAEVTDRLHAGGRIDVEAYVARCPDRADYLRRVLPALELLEGMRSSEGKPGKDVAEGAGAELAGTLGDFRLLREVGRGGMGVVYEAEQISLARRVALKLLPFAGALDAKQLQRFKNEAQAAAALHHTNIVPVHYVGCERGVHFYAMQYIDGQTLAQVIAGLRRSAGGPQAPPSAEPRRPANPPASPGEPTGPNGPAADTRTVAGLATEMSHRTPGYFQTVARLGIQAAEGLQHAHDLGIIHRDVKPGNLLIDGRGNMWVTDFGLARVQSEASLTLSGGLVGTVRYMSPEQALGNRTAIDHRTDVYSLGVTLYELLTLRPAFESNDRQEMLRQITLDEPAALRRLNKAIPAELETVVLKALEKRPEDRYATAQELADDLRRFLEDQPIRARRPSLAQRLRKWARRHRVAVRTAAVCLLMTLAAVLGSVGWVLGDRSARQQEAEVKVREALEAALPGLRRGNPHDPALVAAVQRAQAQLGTGVVGAELQARVEQLLKDQAMLAKLAQARLEGTDVNAEGRFHFPAGDRLFAQAFQEYALDPIVLDLEEAAKRVRASAIRSHLVAALDFWAPRRNILRRGAGTPLSKLAERADDDPWRARLRRAWRDEDRASLERLARDKKVLRQPPANLVHLAAGLSDAGNWSASEQLLRAALVQQPADFWVNFELAWTLHVKPKPDLPEAIRYYQAALTLRPEMPLVYKNMGNALANLDRLVEAETILRQAIALKPNYAGAHNALGILLKKQGKSAAAVSAYRKAIALAPNYAEPYSNLAILLGDQGKLTEAEAACRQSVKLDPGSAGLRINLGITLERRRKMADAEKAFRKANALEPNFAAVHTNLGNFLRRQGRVDEAIVEHYKGVRLNPAVAAAHFSLGNALRDKGRLDDAIASFQAAIRLKPAYPEAHCNLGIALNSKGKKEEAIAEFRQALRFNKDLFEAHHHLGGALLRKGNVQEAIAEYRQAVRLRPNNAETRFDFGTALLEQNDLDGAIAEYRKAILLKKDYLGAHVNLGGALIRKGDLDGAITQSRLAIGIKKDCIEARGNLATALAKKGRLDDAIAIWRQIIQLQPNVAEAHFNLGRAWEEKHDWGAAIAAFRQATNYRVDYADAYLRLGLVYGKKLAWREAASAFRKFIHLRPAAANGHYLLGDALSGLAELPEAVASYKEALRLKLHKAECHCNLGLTLRREGQFAAALEQLRIGHDLGSRRADWHYPSAQWVRDTQREAALDSRLPAFLSGQAKPADAEEQLTLAYICKRPARALYAASVRFYVAALAARSSIPEERKMLCHYDAACAAVLAASGTAKDTAQADERQRRHWREHARQWLHLALAHWASQLENGSPSSRLQIANRLRHWQLDPDLVGVRNSAALAHLPKDERVAWPRLWADVARTLRRAENYNGRQPQPASK
jgi:tetratricopeptide (TPR) repeat protein